MSEEGAPEDVESGSGDPEGSPDLTETASLGGSDGSLGRLGLPDLVEGATMGGYRVLGRLGAGATGAVYLGLDRDRNEPVALKRLHRMDAKGLLRLKREFRQVQALNHRNLIQIHELVEERGNYYLTLEYVDGVPFREWVRSGALGSVVGEARRPDTERLREALRELVEGVQTLHEAGLLHRDLKPANVLVDRTGRVVVLDFGLVADADQPAVDEQSVAGTPAYMAPEQARGEPSSAAVDWYAVGVMLFEALCGRLPFKGGVMQILYQKQNQEPPRPSDLRMAVPSDLDALCVALMRPKPEERPTGPQVMAWLGMRQPEPGLGETAFVGQEEALGELRTAVSRVREGQPATVLVQGPSGVGKTALVRTFLQGLPKDAVVLRGRCYERESVPFKGFDSLIDELAGYLGKRARKDVLPLLPPEVRDLARVFPVLTGVRAVTEAPYLPSSADPLEVRRRAFRGLKELLSRMAQRCTLVLFVDDLQWGDLGAARLLTELLSPPAPPPLLFIASMRSEDLGGRGFAAELRRFATQRDVRSIRVDELPHEQAVDLAVAALGGHGDADRWKAEAIARESRGNPYFLHELVRHALDHPADPEASAGRIALSTVVATRLAELPEAERALAELVSVAGRPLPQGLAQKAAGGLKKPLSAWARLRSVHLVRTHGARGGDPVEPFHDRIREQILAQLPPARQKAHHSSLVDAMEAGGIDDPERLAHHCIEAGLTEKAGLHATQAADRALAALAFERAADFLDQALACTTDEELRRELFVRRAEALAATGRCAEAAPILLKALEGLPEPGAHALTARAAELYLTAGQMERGLEEIRPLLGSLDLELPRSELRGGLAVLGLSLLEFLEGRLRERSPIPDAETRRIDLAWSAGRSLLLWREQSGAALLLRSLRLARRSGDPRRTARGLIMRALMTVGLAPGLARRGLAQAEELAERLDDDYLRGFARATRGSVAVQAGRRSEGLVLLDEGVRILAERCADTAWELSMFTSITARVLVAAGSARELGLRAPRWRSAADQRGDVYLAAIAGLSESWLLAIAGDVEAARQQLDEISESWSDGTRRAQRYQLLCQSVVLDLHERQPRHALLRLRKAWSWLRGTWLVVSPDTRIELLQLWGQASLALAAAGDRDRKRQLRAARRCAFWLRRHRHRDAAGAAAIVEAAWLWQMGRTERALRALDRAASQWELGGRRLQAVLARRRKGMLIDGDEGAALVDEADRVLAEQGVRGPDRWPDALVPGFEGVS